MPATAIQVVVAAFAGNGVIGLGSAQGVVSIRAVQRVRHQRIDNELETRFGMRLAPGSFFGDRIDAERIGSFRPGRNRKVQPRKIPMRQGPSSIAIVGTCGKDRSGRKAGNDDGKGFGTVRVCKMGRNIETDLGRFDTGSVGSRNLRRICLRLNVEGHNSPVHPAPSVGDDKGELIRAAEIGIGRVNVSSVSRNRHATVFRVPIPGQRVNQAIAIAVHCGQPPLGSPVFIGSNADDVYCAGGIIARRGIFISHSTGFDSRRRRWQRRRGCRWRRRRGCRWRRRRWWGCSRQISRGGIGVRTAGIRLDIGAGFAVRRSALDILGVITAPLPGVKRVEITGIRASQFQIFQITGVPAGQFKFIDSVAARWVFIGIFLTRFIRGRAAEFDILQIADRDIGLVIFAIDFFAAGNLDLCARDQLFQHDAGNGRTIGCNQGWRFFSGEKAVYDHAKTVGAG